MLRQQLEAIRKELGEFDESAAEASELRQQLDAIALPEEVRRQVDRELKRLEQLPPQAAEHGVIRTYLEWIASLPWDTSTEDNLDLTHAREVLDEDHYDIEQVKDRILEFLAVRAAEAGRAAAAILCFVGPPGVGKTSLGPLDRPRAGPRVRAHQRRRHARRGRDPRPPPHVHRRDARHDHPRAARRGLEQPAVHDRRDRQDGQRTAAAIRRARCSRCSTPSRTRPSATTTSTSRSTSRDVMFITTANTLDTIPGPLRDRMEVIELAGYTEEEKLEIAKRYLVPRQIERNGLKKSWIAITDKALRVIISDYTREAGVRNLEREIGTVCRKIARVRSPRATASRGA